MPFSKPLRDMSSEYAASANSNQQMMKECMAKQKAENNGMSVEDKSLAVYNFGMRMRLIMSEPETA